MKIILLVLLTCTSAVVQTSDDLQKKYGTPLSQTYMVRPGITVTVTFKDGKTCEMLIEPERRLTMKSSTPKLTLRQLDEIIDELVPVKERGKPLAAGFVNATCLPDDDCQGTSATYEKISIYYNVSGVDAYRYATIQWGDQACKR